MAAIETPMSPAEVRGTARMHISMSPAMNKQLVMITGMLTCGLYLYATKMLKKMRLNGIPILNYYGKLPTKWGSNAMRS